MTKSTASSAIIVPNRAIPRSSLGDSLRTRRLGGWPFLVAGFIGLVMVAYIYLGLTYVSGIELNTHTWEQRVVSYRRDPLSGFQFTSVQHNAPLRDGLWGTRANPRSKKIDPLIASHLNGKTNLPLRWDLVELDNSQLPGAEASILVNLLNATDRDFTSFWPQWSNDHPQEAAVLWPAARELVEFGQYAKLPALFELALLEKNSSSQLSSGVGQLVQSALLEACQLRVKQGNHSEARVAAQVGLRYGTHPDLQKFVESDQ